MNLTAAIGQIIISKIPKLVFGSFVEEELEKEITLGVQKFTISEKFEAYVELSILLKRKDPKEEVIKMSCVGVVQVTLDNEELGKASEDMIREKIISEVWPIFETNVVLLNRFKIAPFQLPPYNVKHND
jgi:hypothetical protein